MNMTRDLLEEYHGLHVASAWKDHERLAWVSPAVRCGRVRVRRHTCSRCLPCYEFCVAAGLAFIRRSTHSGMHETAWTLAAEAERVWWALLMGAAR
ncbi:hypothetical protein GCM10023096_01590 [Nonomuraea ferruginea]